MIYTTIKRGAVGWGVHTRNSCPCYSGIFTIQCLVCQFNSRIMWNRGFFYNHIFSSVWWWTPWSFWFALYILQFTNMTKITIFMIFSWHKFRNTPPPLLFVSSLLFSFWSDGRLVDMIYTVHFSWPWQQLLSFHAQFYVPIHTTCARTHIDDRYLPWCLCGWFHSFLLL